VRRKPTNNPVSGPPPTRKTAHHLVAVLADDAVVCAVSFGRPFRPANPGVIGGAHQPAPLEKMQFSLCPLDRRLKQITLDEQKTKPAVLRVARPLRPETYASSPKPHAGPQAQDLYGAHGARRGRAWLPGPRPANLESLLSGHFHPSQPKTVHHYHYEHSLLRLGQAGATSSSTPPSPTGSWKTPRFSCWAETACASPRIPIRRPSSCGRLRASAALCDNPSRRSPPG